MYAVKDTIEENFYLGILNKIVINIYKMLQPSAGFLRAFLHSPF